MFLATGSPTEWAVFSALVVVLLVLDLGVFHRKAHRVSAREALTWSLVWIGVALCFNAYVWATDGKKAGLEFLAGYLIEKWLLSIIRAGEVVSHRHSCVRIGSILRAGKGKPPLRTRGGPARRFPHDEGGRGNMFPRAPSRIASSHCEFRDEGQASARAATG